MINLEEIKPVEPKPWIKNLSDTEREQLIAHLDEWKRISDSWNALDMLDQIEVMIEAEKYTDPSNVDSMTLEETLNLIEKHNPSFAKAKRKEMVAQNADPALSQPMYDLLKNKNISCQNQRNMNLKQKSPMDG